jgi:hypothetical protein
MRESLDSASRLWTAEEVTMDRRQATEAGSRREEVVTEAGTVNLSVPERQPTMGSIALGARSPVSSRALAVGAAAFGACAFGALAIGTLAIGRIAIGSLRMKRGRFGRLEVEELSVGRLHVRELLIERSLND